MAQGSGFSVSSISANRSDERNQGIRLTDVDRKILQSYCDLLDGLADYFGKSYEFVLHSLEDFNHSAVKVVNGFHTGRSVGAPITDLGLVLLHRFQSGKDRKKHYVYFTKNKDGEPYRSTTMAIIGENDRLIGYLCINYYMDAPVSELIRNLTKGEHFDDDGDNPGAELYESFSSDSSELIEDVTNRVREEVYEDTSISSANKNKEIIRRLNVRGIFNYKDAVIEVANILNISKNTVYLHLRNLSLTA